MDTEIVNYGLWLARNGHSPEILKARTEELRMLSRRIGTLLDDEVVKDYVARVSTYELIRLRRRE